MGKGYIITLLCINITAVNKKIEKDLAPWMIWESFLFDH